MTVELYCDYVGFLLVLYMHTENQATVLYVGFFEKFCTLVINPTLPNLLQSYLYLINCGFVVCRIIQCHNVTILIFIAVHGIALLHCFADSCELRWTTV